MDTLQLEIPSPITIPQNWHIIITDLQDCLFNIPLHPLDQERFTFSLPPSIPPGSAAAAVASLQLCPTLCDPIDGSQPGFPSLGFSRQEHWSGLPFPSPMHESEK